MKFDPSIIFFLIIVFFVLRSVFKKKLAKKRIKKMSDASVLLESSSASGMKTEAKTRDVFETTGSENSSILWKIILQARQFIREAQRRAEEQKQLQQQNHVNFKNRHGQNQTGNLKQAEKSQQPDARHSADARHLRDDIHSIQSNHSANGIVEPGVLNSEKAEYISEGMSFIKDKSSIAGQKGRGTVPDKKYYFKTDPLQNAVIWSEILSKPLALKDNS